MNDGAGNFTPELLTAQSFPGSPLLIDVADLNGDGAQDIVVSHRIASSSYQLTYFPAQGGSQAGPGIPILVGSTVPFAVADLDGDGAIDIATSNASGELLWTRGLGAGAFAPGVTIQASGGETLKFPATLRDFDGDGDADVLQAQGVGVVYFDAQGGGAFGPGQAIGDPLASSVSGMAINVDGDGLVDILRTQYFQSGAFASMIYRQTSPGVFGAGIATSAAADFGQGTADLNGNGRDDIVRGIQNGAVLRWFVNRLPETAGFFDSEEVVLPSPLNQIAKSVASDLDGDGDDDIVVTARASGVVGWIENLGFGVLASPSRLFTSAAEPSEVKIADMDGDFDLDVVLQFPGALEIWLNDGSQQFSLASTHPWTGPANYRIVVVEDMDGDGAGEILLSFPVPSTPHLEMQLLTNSGAGLSFTSSTVIDGTDQALDVQTGDFDGDLFRDLAIVRNSGQTNGNWLEILIGMGNGAFGSPLVLPMRARAQRVTVADFDLDGLSDLLVHDLVDGVMLRRALGSGAFAAPSTLNPTAALTGTERVQVIDFDVDGDQDLIYSEIEFNANYVLRLAEQDPVGVMRDGFTLGGPGGNVDTVLPLTFGDIDGDGDGDVIVPSFLRLRGHINVGTIHVGSAFCTGPSYAVSPLSIVGSDRLVDGQVRLIATNPGNNSFGMALTSQTTSPPMPVGGTQGTLCLSGAIGRFNQPGQILNSAQNRPFDFRVNLQAMATPGGTIPAQIGQTWSFQIWHRSPSGSSAGSRFTSGAAVTLR